MKSLWIDEEAARCQTELALRVYTSRLLGREPALVLHGGGNTSVKVVEQNLFGEEERILYMKGSGWDLGTIEEAGFAPVRLQPMLRLAGLDALSDPEMVNAFCTHKTKASAPTPSVETVLHAVLPFKYVDHTHADAVVTVTNTPGGEARVREVYTDRAIIIPYAMPGFDLARLVAERFPAQASEHTIGMVLMNHGIFSFGNNAQESYERMIDLVTLAEDYLATKDAWELVIEPTAVPRQALGMQVATLRHDISRVAGYPIILITDQSARAMAFIQRSDCEEISQQGPATPDHIIRTKRVPQLGRDVASYAQAYCEYFETHRGGSREGLTMLDAAPRVVLDETLGLCTVGRKAKDAAIVRDIYRHTMDVVERATKLTRYQALPEEPLFQVEYWDLEQAKLRKRGNPPVFEGEVALVTGAASGIGRACLESFAARGAAVAGLDIAPLIESVQLGADPAGTLNIRCDVTDEQQIRDALERTVRAFGGLDMLVLNAGVFPVSCPIAELRDKAWRDVMSVNLDANVNLMRDAHPLLRLAPRGGRVVVIGSKNVFAPGPGAAAYSASKAALNQLGRVAAMEWAGDGIRVNTIHPNAVFDTAIWTEEVLASRAAHYNLTVEAYQRRNLLGVKVTSKDVAELAAEMCGPVFSRTTGAQVPVDGGDERVV
jgi:rhamnose utilization protein RhaD (predicted bifunctional aldolase and dehydrogenase)/NAD(P)-dependent dehydrogenase (short-subunit alcohol dehydrogenase family)